MSAVIIDFKTRRIISDGEPVVEQQKTFSRDEMMETLIYFANELEKEGYTFVGSVLVLPNTDPKLRPASISVTDDGTAKDMAALLKPAYVDLVRAAKQEEMTEGVIDNDPAA